jgi:hypothetical protein
MYSVGTFFEILEKEYEKYRYHPDDVSDVDKTGLSVVQGRVLEVVQKERRRTAPLTSSEGRRLMTVIAAMEVSLFLL